MTIAPSSYRRRTKRGSSVEAPQGFWGTLLENVSRSEVLLRLALCLGAGVVLTASTAIVDVTGPEPVEYSGRVPARSVVIPGTRPKKFPAGEYGVPCALIIGQRSAATDKKVSLNAALRDFGVSV